MKRKLLVLGSLIAVIILAACGLSTGCKTAATAETTATTAAAAVTETTAAAVETTAAAETTAASTGGTVDFQALYAEVSKLQGEEALKFFNSLPEKGLKGLDIIKFFVDLPVSPANKQINQILTDEGFKQYLDAYPKGDMFDNFKWEIGMGAQIVGPVTKQNLKIPFSDYIPVADGPIGDASKTYKIGSVVPNFEHPWMLNYIDAEQWEADRHPNLEFQAISYEWDLAKASTIVDQFIAEKVDGILFWALTEAPSGPPVQRAEEAGIPVVSVDRLTGYKDITSRVSGNFPANGAQCGMYLVWKLAQEGSLKANIVMLRKPLGSTADAVRTGHFLTVLSYFPDINILQSFHDADNQEDAFKNAQNALQAFDNIDVFFGTGDSEALAALEATKMAGRLTSREGGKKIIYLSIDDSREALTDVKNGEFEVNTPYSPTVSDIGIRVLINIITGAVKMPYNVMTPDIPMVTQNGDVIFGLQTQKPDQWYEYAWGAEPTK
jgi:ribose transport system substrate-binding protein